MKKAIAYIRFSSANQDFGTSYTRQIDYINKWHEDHKDFELEVREDLGIPSYRGQNLKAAFGDILEDIASGKIPKGSYLLFEAHDRLTRVGPGDALRLFQSLLDQGMTLVFLKDNTTVTGKDSNSLQFLIQTIFSAETSHQESRKKSERLQIAWDLKRKKAIEDGKRLGRTAKGWLIYKDGRYKVDETKSKTVKLLFQLYETGNYSIEKLLRHLHSNNITPISKTRNKRTYNVEKRTRESIPMPPKWNKAYVRKLLTDRAVIGECQLYKSVDGKQKPIHDPIKDYYPAIISKELFNKVQDRLFTRRKERKTSGSHINLFTGLVMDKRGSPMYCLKRDGMHRFVSDETVNNHPDAIRITVPYEKVETLVLLALTELEYDIEDKTIPLKIEETKLREQKLSILKEMQNDMDGETLSLLSNKLKTTNNRLSEIASYIKPTPQDEIKTTLSQMDKKKLKLLIPTIIDRIVLFGHRNEQKKVEGVIVIRLLDRSFRIASFHAVPKKEKKTHKYFNGSELLAVVHSIGTVSVKPLEHLWRSTTHTIPRTPRPKRLDEWRSKEWDTSNVEEQLAKVNDLIDSTKLRTRTNRKKHA